MRHTAVESPRVLRKYTACAAVFGQPFSFPRNHEYLHTLFYRGLFDGRPFYRQLHTA